MIDEEFEGVVDCCEADPGVRFADGCVEFFGGGVGLGRAECFVDQESGFGTADGTVCKDFSRGVVLMRRLVACAMVLRGLTDRVHGMILRETRGDTQRILGISSAGSCLRAVRLIFLEVAG